MLSYSIITKIALFATLLFVVVAYITPYWVTTKEGTIFGQVETNLGILYFIVTFLSATEAGTYSRAFPIPVGFLVGDICLGVGIIFLIVSIVQFFQSSKYLNANAVSSFYAQKKHRQSLGFLATTLVLIFITMVVVTAIEESNKTGILPNSFGSSSSSSSSFNSNRRPSSFGNNDRFGTTFNSNRRPSTNFGSSNNNDPFRFNINSNSRGKRALNNFLSGAVPEVSYHFSFYFGWVSLLFSIIALTFNILVYQQTFSNRSAPANTQVTYKA